MILGTHAGRAAPSLFDDALGAAAWNPGYVYAAENGAVIVTKDEDFVARQVLATGPPVVWIRPGNTRRSELLRRIESQFDAIVEAFERGERLVEIV